MDIGGTPYSRQADISGEALGKPKSRDPALNIGMSLKPWQVGRGYLLTCVDMHAVNQPYPFSKKLNLGTELGLSQTLKIGLGLHQGYLSGGVQIDVGLLNLRFVSYAEELGVTAGENMDRRYAFQVKLLI
jgi:hypothetical protein